ncbi:hypothetical protein CBR_g16078 [Chara braunii]|uniref:Uncharacterized protein n=1 Tax=Chara braunii TaxID=69332 RepID=A0A388KTH5_CHABU|nr:hypothetical protein CBR_g16078 [Chara braunii]|eukprot:GBG73364.1 hypothetical protein CBR_g16078 [Chara braunii]
MSFLTERVLGEHLLAPRDDISAIRQVHHPRLSPDSLWFVQFFNTTGVYAPAEFRFVAHNQAFVLAEASAYQQLSIPGVSHVSTIVVFSGYISTVDPLRHTAIRVSLRKWGEQLAAKWNQWLARHSDNLVVTDSINVGGLRTSRRKPAVWSACLEDLTGGGSYPSRVEYLKPRGIIDVLFFSPRTAVEERVVAEKVEVEDESEEETLKEEGSYSEYSEEEPEEEDEEEEQEGQLEEEEESEWETLGEEADCAEAPEEDPEAAARRREEIAVGKQPLEFASGADLPISNDPTKDPEPPKNDGGDPTAETSSAPACRRRSRSRSRPPIPQFEHVSMRAIGLRSRSLSHRPLELPHPPPDYHPGLFPPEPLPY